VPSRAIVVVYLAAAMLAAVGFAALRERRRLRWAVLLGALTVVDLVPARPPLFRVTRPRIYDALGRRRETGAICELPLGLRDSFGETGRFSSLILWHQTIHERPMAGGFVSRLPPRITTGYLTSPIFGPLLRLSAGDAAADMPLPDRNDAIDALLGADIRFLVLDRAASPPALAAFVEHLHLARIDEEGTREILLVAR
jgi:hypothetical protein